MLQTTPPGSDRENALKAARDFLAEEYGSLGHEYVFVAHNDTEHPHVHAAIKVQSCYGAKLNPRKADLRRAREHFAEKCRKYGIDVEASPRHERGLSGKSKKSEFVQMRRYGRKPRADQILVQKIKTERASSSAKRHPSEEKMLKRNQIIRKRYAEKAKELKAKAAIQTDPKQQTQYTKAAALLERHAKTMPLEAGRGEKVHRQLDQKQGTPANRPASRPAAIEALNQFYAITEGAANEQGIYVSPTEQLAQEMTAAIFAEQEQSREQALEMDFDD